MVQPKNVRLVTELAQDEYRDEVLPQHFTPITRANLPAGTDLNDARTRDFTGAWNLSMSNAYDNLPEALTSSAQLVIDYSNLNNGFTQTLRFHLSGKLREWTRKLINVPSGVPVWTDWMRTPDVLEVSQSPSQQILELARQDGWTEIYDPTNPDTRSVNSVGLVTELRGGLGNLGALTAGTAPRLNGNHFAQLSGISDGYLQGNFGRSIAQPYTVLALVHDSSPLAAPTRAAIGGGLDLYTLEYSGRPYFAPHAGLNPLYPAPHDTAPHLIRATASNNDPTEAIISLDGEPEGIVRGANVHSVMSMGANLAGANPWPGVVGVVAILEDPAGSVREEKIRRMSNLIMSLAGIVPKSPRIPYKNVVYSEDSYDQPEFIHGHPDRVNTGSTVGPHPGPTIASLTKVMTLWLARKYLSDSDMDDEVEVHADDVRNTLPLIAGDKCSWMAIFHLIAKESNNTGPHVVARLVGQMILDQEGGSGDPRARFVDEMNAEAERLGYVGAMFANPQFGAHMSPTQLADLFRRSMADPVLREAHRLGEVVIEITPADDPVTSYTVVHNTSKPTNPFPTGDIIAAKTGSNYGYAHVVFLWLHPDGSEHVGVVLNTDQSNLANLYRPVRKLIQHIAGGGSYIASGVGFAG